MAHRRVLTACIVSVATALAGAAVAVASPATDGIVSVASPPGPFSQNKQNEPAVAIDAHEPGVVVAGSNDEIDEESCAAGDPTTCPFTPGVGVSGVYFSFTGGSSWTQPTYTGLTARDCLGPVACTAHTGPIGTLPGYAAKGLVSDGDPAVAFGPRPGSDGSFSWDNGSRLYYANLTSNVSADKESATFKGFEAIAVSRTDDVRAAAAGHASAWKDPVIISKQSSTTFSDKEQVWADNAQSSRFFGNVYVCWASFRSNSHGNAFPTPLIVARSTNGGATWTTKQVGPATDNGINGQPDGCTVRTDSHGNVYVFGIGRRAGADLQLMYRSTDGGAHWTGPTMVAPVTSPGVFDPVLGRPTMDGIAGARVDLASGPNVDIANGAPSGAGATNQIVMTWADGASGLDHERLLWTSSTTAGASWTAPAALALPTGDRPFYTAPALSPDGTDLYVVDNAFTTPFRHDTSSPRGLVGQVWHANVVAGVPSGWSSLDRSAVGDPRGTSQNGLTAEFLGDYVYASATRDAVVGVWNDASHAADCPAIDAYRASLYTATPTSPPNVLVACPNTFGNSDIRGGSWPDPTP
ncbi:sialidase family protein [Terrabacter sp. Root181]|uniref:sialidase family protein n=1 Tax=Terrabacter sp. Root181 TaxID=1736484 RepID=UPI000AD5DA32|nr:sialidase family protein [Terrabacter sp. Root181]